MAKYQWKLDAGPTPNIDAQAFGDAVEKLAGSLKSAKPEDIVEMCRPKSSPFHRALKWNNEEAGELYRREQVRHLIGALQIVRVEFSEGPTISSRAFFSVSTGKRTGYVDHTRILNDSDLKKQVLDAARKELENYIRKFGSVMALGNFIQRLQSVVDEMQEAADSIVKEATRKPKPRPRPGDDTHTSPTGGAAR